MRNSGKSPVLIITYNRASLLNQVLTAVLEYNPPSLYIFCDGPKSSLQDINFVNEVRESIVKFSSSFHGNFQVFLCESNLGCKDSVESAIDWVFRSEKFAVILEDDCLPSQSFFRFIDKARDSYELESRVIMISGRNPFAISLENRVYFTNGGIWGWATWADRWNDRNSQRLSVSKILENRFARSFMSANPWRFRRIYSGSTRIWDGQLDSWDYTWALSRVLTGGVVAIPPFNLVRNIGFLTRPTHAHHLIPKVDSVKPQEIDTDKINYIPFTKIDSRLLKLEDRMLAGSVWLHWRYNLGAIFWIFRGLLKDSLKSAYKRKVGYSN